MACYPDDAASSLDGVGKAGGMALLFRGAVAFGNQVDQAGGFS